MNSLSAVPYDFSCADLLLDVSRRQAICGNKSLILRVTPFRLLTLLTANAGEVVSRESIFENVWGYDFDPGTKRIEVHLNYLRRHLAVLGCAVKIRTFRGEGVCLYQVRK